MKTRRWSKQLVKARPVIGWVIVAMLVSLELWTASAWYGDQAGRGAGQAADTNLLGLTAPVFPW